MTKIFVFGVLIFAITFLGLAIPATSAQGFNSNQTSSSLEYWSPFLFGVPIILVSIFLMVNAALNLRSIKYSQTTTLPRIVEQQLGEDEKVFSQLSNVKSYPDAQIKANSFGWYATNKRVIVLRGKRYNKSIPYDQASIQRQSGLLSSIIALAIFTFLALLSFVAAYITFTNYTVVQGNTAYYYGAPLPISLFFILFGIILFAWGVDVYWLSKGGQYRFVGASLSKLDIAYTIIRRRGWSRENADRFVVDLAKLMDDYRTGRQPIA